MLSQQNSRPNCQDYSSIINNLSSIGEVVLDPMAGSCVTILEAALLERDAIGFDIDPLSLILGKAKFQHFKINEAYHEGNTVIQKDRWEKLFEKRGPFFALQVALMQWCEQSEKPIVLFIDEIDSLVGDTLIAVLRQLRSGYEKRPELFPQSIVLCGVRDVKDYRMHSDRGSRCACPLFPFSLSLFSLENKLGL